MSKVTLYCHRKINSTKCICDYVGTYDTFDHVINGTTAIDSFPDNGKVYQEEVDKREYCYCRSQENEDGYTVCGICR